MNDLTERLRAAYDAWSASRAEDIDRFVALAAPDLTLRSPLLEAEGGDPALRGPEAVGRFLGGIRRDWEMLDFVTEEIVAQGDTLVWTGRCTWRHRASGRELTTAKADIWHFRDGRAVRFAEMFDTLGFARAAGMI